MVTFRRGKYESPFSGPPPRYTGPIWIGKPIKTPPIEAGPGWVGVRIPFRSLHNDDVMRLSPRRV